VEKGRWRISEGLCMDRYFVSMGGFSKEVDLKGVNVMGLVHLVGITVQDPFDVFCIIHMVMHIDVAVTDQEKIPSLGRNRSRNLLGLFHVGFLIKQMENFSEERLNPLGPSTL
jgi:hypothetical protein